MRKKRSPLVAHSRRLSAFALAGFMAAAAFILLIRATPHASQPEPDWKSRCTTIIVGKDASSDRSVILAHNEDLGNDAAQHYLTVPHQKHASGEFVTLWSGARVPQVNETYAYIATTVFDRNYVPGDLTTGINEYQVAVANNLAYEREAADPAPTAGRILWSEFTRLVLERARTAREAIRLVGRLAQTYKLASDPGTMFGVTDATEGWWVEIAQEGQWVAERVADNAAGMRANAYRIGRVDFNRPNDFMFSDDLLSYARARGWSTGDGQSFDFARVYGDPAKSQATWNTHREERVEQLLRDHLPQITVPHLMAILRDHYEGTARDLTQGFRSGSPHHTMERAVCNMSTELGVIFQSRGWLPAEIGAVSWRAMTTPCSSVFVPWYLGHEQVPAAYEKGTNAYTPGSAYWVFRRLSETVDANYGRLIGPVRSHWSQFESQEFADQAPLENSALGIYFFDPSFARSVLTAYSNSRALRVLQDAEQFLSASSGQTHRSDWTARLF